MKYEGKGDNVAMGAKKIPFHIQVAHKMHQISKETIYWLQNVAGICCFSNL